MRNGALLLVMCLLASVAAGPLQAIEATSARLTEASIHSGEPVLVRYNPAPSTEEAHLVFEARQASLDMTHGDPYVYVPSVTAGTVTPRKVSYEWENVSLRSTWAGMDRFLYVEPAGAGVVADCIEELARSEDAEIQVPDAIERENPNRIHETGSLLAASLCMHGLFSICGAMRIALWDWTLAAEHAGGSSVVTTGLTPVFPGAPVGNASQAYVETEDGCLTLDSSEGPTIFFPDLTATASVELRQEPLEWHSLGVVRGVYTPSTAGIVGKFESESAQPLGGLGSDPWVAIGGGAAILTLAGLVGLWRRNSGELAFRLHARGWNRRASWWAWLACLQHPRSTELLVLRAEISESLGWLRSARRLYERALARTPTGPRREFLAAHLGRVGGR